MAKINYLIGNGENLVSASKIELGWGEGTPAYSFDEVIERTIPQWKKVIAKSKRLPDTACPNNNTVLSITLHPKYLAMSHYPWRLFSDLNLKSIGSRASLIKPKKPRSTKQKSGSEDIAPEYFLSVDRNQLPAILEKISNPSKELKDEYIKIESINPLKDKRIKTANISGDQNIVWEAVLQGYEEYIIKGFKKHINSFDITCKWDNMFREDGLWFVPFISKLELIKSIGQFSFLRVVRPMPSLRPITPLLREVIKEIDLDIPNINPLDDKYSAAILDGGLPRNHGLRKWVRYRKTSDLGPAHKTGLDHGLAVTSSFLFGPLDGSEIERTPPSRVDHWRIIDKNDFDEEDIGLYKVLKRITDILDQNSYKIVNLSIGPNIPIEDDEPHAWTAVLDSRLSDGKTLLCCAAGNNGELDKESGNARIQPPSDVINGLGIGSADSMTPAWKRCSYSCIGPGRRPGYVKPDILAFGGSKRAPFGVIDSDGTIKLTQGTSFASPYVAHLGMGVSSFFESDFTANSLKALLINNADANGHDQIDVGWGKLPDDLNDLIVCQDGEAHILYQGVFGNRNAWRLPIPIPEDIVVGRLKVKITICFSTVVEPNHPLNYTKAGLVVYFRPRPQDDPKKTYPFFQNHSYWPAELELRTEAMKWEPVLKAEKGFLGKSLKNPVLDIHYLTRQQGQQVNRRPNLSYSAIVSIYTPKINDIYGRILNRYRLELVPLRPRLEIEHRIKL